MKTRRNDGRKARRFQHFPRTLDVVVAVHLVVPHARRVLCDPQLALEDVRFGVLSRGWEKGTAGKRETLVRAAPESYAHITPALCFHRRTACIIQLASD